jgi:hypothetical protein
MDAIIEFYIHDLQNNPELARDDRDKYLNIINAYTQAVLQRMLD